MDALTGALHIKTPNLEKPLRSHVVYGEAGLREYKKFSRPSFL
jgi:hypothetical protein